MAEFEQLRGPAGVETLKNLLMENKQMPSGDCRRHDTEFAE